jgi:hypothetical protein
LAEGLNMPIEHAASKAEEQQIWKALHPSTLLEADIRIDKEQLKSISVASIFDPPQAVTPADKEDSPAPVNHDGGPQTDLYNSTSSVPVLNPPILACSLGNTQTDDGAFVSDPRALASD